MLAVGVVSTRSPSEALEALEFVTNDLGMKAIVVNGHNLRRSEGPDAREYVDTIAYESTYDYEPFWRRCSDDGIAVTDHAGSMFDSTRRRSPNNFVFNHVGHFAESMAANAKAVFLGGVVNRYPRLKFAFLEAGVGFALNLLFDLEGHWEKRNIVSVHELLRPSNIQVDEFLTLFDKYGSGLLSGKGKEVFESIEFGSPNVSVDELTLRETESVDDFSAIGVASKRELRAQFTKNFYFGCEPDDLMTTIAFDHRFNSGLKPIFGSDIGHFDVPVMADVLTEAWELVEDGFITESDFRQFTFSNAVELHGGGSNGCFAGTRVAEQVGIEVERINKAVVKRSLEGN
jgi:hypothetical protein